MKQFIRSSKALGSVIKRVRKAKNIGQTAVGSAFKIDQGTVSSIENGAPGTRLETVFRILAALDLEMIIQPRKVDKKNLKKEEW